MDEGILNELLECSVCLERLDSSSKVLPCQHTFCKRCLEEIYTSRNELRCPECRILVETKICDLPNNFLLIRLLEGIKSVPRITNKQDGTNSNLSSTNSDKEGDQESESSKQSKSSILPRPGKNAENKVATQKQVVQPHPCAKALYSYEAKEPGDLSFKKGDIIMLKKKIDQNWYHGELGNKHGFFPVTYVQIITPLPNHLPQAKALFDFSFHERDEKDCLSFKKGDILTVIRRIDENWVEGKISDKIGIFPITFVEMNSAARAIVKLSSSVQSGPVREAPPAPQPQPVVLSPTPSHIIATSTSSESSSTTSAVQISQPSSRGDALSPATSSQVQSTSTFASTTQVSNSTIPQPLPQPPSHPKHLIHRQQREKRHSVSVASVSTLTPARHNNAFTRQTNRHSIDASHILSPINIPSHIARTQASSHPIDEQGNANKSTSVTATTSATTTSVTTSSHVLSTEGGTCNLVRRHSSSRREKSNNSAHTNHSRQHSAPDPSSLPPSSGAHPVHAQVPVFYVAMYSYKPQKEDELELKKSELYTVSEKCLDGWFKGTSLRNAQTGVFPGNYVQVAKSSVLQANFQQILSSNSSIKSLSNSSSNSQSSKSPAPQAPKDKNQGTSVQRTNAPILDGNASTSPSHVRTNLTVSSPPPRPPRPQVSRESMENASTNSPWVAKSDANHLLPQPPKMTVALPPHNNQLTCVTMVSSIPVAVNTSSHGQAVCCTTASQSWHGVIPSTSRSPTIALSSASAVTTCNVAVTNSPSGSKASHGKIPKDKKEKEKVSTVLKRLTGVKKKSKSPPPTNFSMDNPNFVDASIAPVVHIRSGSCPSENLTSVASHKKTIVNESDAHSNVAATSRPKQPAPLVRERFRCIVPYPPNSDYELELKIGDVIYVHKRREDGWYKGTLQRTGITGLFPGSFVEKF